MKKLFIVLFLLSYGLTFAGDPARKGTTGAEQLLIPVGARSIATGGAFLANIQGVEAIYYNPAGLDASGKSEAMFSYMSYIADINVSYFAVGTHLGDLGSFAFSFQTFDFGEIPVTTFEAPDGTGATYSPSFFTAGITYAKTITDRVTAGLTVKLINETIMATNAVGFAGDFGVQYRFPGNLSLGVAVKNIGSNMSYSGQDLQVKRPVDDRFPGSRTGPYAAVTEEFGIPSYFEISTTYNYNINEENNVLLGTTFRNNNSLEDQLAFGLEYGFMNTFFVRGGYNMMLENSKESIYGLTLGAGINYAFSDGLGFAFDYAYRDVKDFPTANHIFTVKLALD